MVFGQLCAPALIYIVFSITQITMDSLKGMYNIAFVKLFISLLFTILLNHLCQRGLGIIFDYCFYSIYVDVISFSSFDCNVRYGCKNRKIKYSRGEGRTN